MKNDTKNLTDAYTKREVVQAVVAVLLTAAGLFAVIALSEVARQQYGNAWKLGTVVMGALVVGGIVTAMFVPWRNGKKE